MASNYILRFGAACFLMSHALAFITIDSSSGHYVDEYGRVRVFHGLNAVYKLAPWHPDLFHDNYSTSLTHTDMQNLQNWGFNVLRLGIQWDGTEVNSKLQPHVYNMSYLQTMRSLVDTLGSYGIYSIADMHEDSLSRYYCGEGIPDAYINPNATAFPFPFPLPISIPTGSDGYPDLSVCTKVNFGLYLFTVAEQSSWATLYKNGTNFQGGWASFWNVVGATFNSSQYLLAHELINEPQAGDVYANPLDFLIPGQGDQNNLAPVYKTLHDAIRVTDKNHIIMYEPAVSETVLRQETGFASGPGGPGEQSLNAFAYHLYCFNQNSTGDITNVTDCASNLNAYWQIELANKKKVGGGSFMTEFGAVGPALSSAESIGVWTDLADTTLESWTYWSYKSFDDITTQNPATETLYNDDGTLQMLKLAALSRTYAPTISGVPGSISMKYDTATANFTLSYTINTGVPANERITTVYLNEDIHYPNGFTYSVLPAGAATVVQGQRNYLTIQHAAAAAGQLIFTLQAK